MPEGGACFLPCGCGGCTGHGLLGAAAVGSAHVARLPACCSGTGGKPACPAPVLPALLHPLPQLRIARRAQQGADIPANHSADALLLPARPAALTPHRSALRRLALQRAPSTAPMPQAPRPSGRSGRRSLKLSWSLRGRSRRLLRVGHAALRCAVSAQLLSMLCFLVDLCGPSC